MRHVNSATRRRSVLEAAAAYAAIAMMLVVAACGGDGSAPVTVASLRFLSAPTTVSAGVPFSASVELLDDKGNRAKGAKDMVTIAVVGGAALTGPASVAAVDGVATFDGLSLATPTASVQLSASVNGLLASSSPFTVKSGPPSAVNTTITPAACNLPINSSVGLSMVFKDGSGNALSAVPISLSTALAGATFTPASGTTLAGGGFETVIRATSTGAASITATVDGSPFTFATPFTFVTPPAAPAVGALSIPGQATGTVASGPCVTANPVSLPFRFTMAADGAVSFALNAPFTSAYFVTEDPPTEIGAYASANPGTSGPFDWLLPAGTYQFNVYAIAGTGAFTATSASTAGNTGCSLRFLVKGLTINQNLLTGDCILQDDGSIYDPFLIDTRRPCTITLKSSAFTPWIIIADAETGDGGFVGGAGVGVDATISLTSCTGDTGALIIAPNGNPGESGPYQLIITLGPLPAGGPPAIESSLRKGSSLGSETLRRGFAPTLPRLNLRRDARR